MKKKNLFSFITLAVFPVVILAGSLGCQHTPNTSTDVTVSYNANGGQISSDIAKTVSVGNTVTLPSATRINYVFDGWYTAPDGGTRVGGDGDLFAVEANIALYAQWISEVIVYFNANSGIVSPSSMTVTAGSSITLPASTRGGYTFYGWYNTQGVKIGAAGDKYSVTGEQYFQGSLVETLTAEWKLNVTVTFNMTGGSTLLPSITAPAESSITLPEPTRSGYTFTGWYLSISGTMKAGGAGDSYTIPNTVGATMELFARWVPGGVTVIYNANGGVVSPPEVTVTTGSSITLPVPTRSGYVFTGWFSAISGGTKVGGTDNTFRVETSLTLYAQWEIHVLTD